MMMPSDACRAHGHLPSDCFGCPMCHRAGSRTGCGTRWEGKSEICAFRGLFLIWWEQEKSKSREEQQYLWGDAPTASLKVLHPQSGSGVYPAMTATLSFQTHGSSSRCSQIARIR